MDANGVYAARGEEESWAGRKGSRRPGGRAPETVQRVAAVMPVMSKEIKKSIRGRVTFGRTETTAMPRCCSENVKDHSSAILR